SKIELDREKYDLHVLIREVSKLIKPLAKEKNLKIKLLLDGGKQAYIDREKIHQVIYNLLENAVKYTDRGSIEVATAEGEGMFQIFIKDTGRGIDPQHLERLFDQFYRVPEKKGSYTKGTGLGLAIAKGWTEAHGGKLRVKSNGRG